MAKLQILFLIGALCVLLPAAGAHDDHPKFNVQGQVYCDACRAGFITVKSGVIQGAKVQVQCRNFSTDKVTFEAEGETNTLGTYQIPVTGDHEEDICEVHLVSSPVADCKEIKPGLDKARIVLTSYSGMTAKARFANPLSFLKDKALPECADLLLQSLTEEVPE